MLKAEIIDYLLEYDIERRIIGARYSSTWVRRRQQYLKQRKIDLEMRVHYYAQSGKSGAPLYYGGKRI